MRAGARALRTAVACTLAALLTGCGQGLFTRSTSAAGQDAAASDGGDGVADTGSDPTTRSLNLKAGADGTLQLAQGSATVRSMSFDEDVVLTIEIVDSPAVGPISKTYRIGLQPLGAHARNPIRLAVSLDAAGVAIHDQLKLATYQVRTPVGLWIAAPGQQYDDVAQLVWADVSGLDREPISFALLQSCSSDAACDPRQNCNATLCQ